MFRLFPRPGRTAALWRTVCRQPRPLSNASSVSVDLEAGGREIAVDWGRGAAQPRSVFHSAWLRHNCPCSSCVTTSGQKAVLSTDVDPNASVLRARINDGGGEVEVRWSCGHEGRFKMDWLRQHCYSLPNIHSAMEYRRPSTTSSLPEMSAKDIEEEIGLWRWLKQLNEYGVSLLRGVPVVKESLKPIMEKVSHIQKSIYGEMFDVTTVEDPINVAYTGLNLELHMDLAYYESTPGLQFLFCLRNDECVEGGENVVVDGMPVLDRLKREHPDHFSTLCSVPATFQKIHYDRPEPVHMVYHQPHIMLNKLGQIIKFTWAPSFEGPLRVPQEDVEPYYRAYSCLARMLTNPEVKITYKLTPGDILVFNNHRMLHGRSAFQLNGGVRHYVGAYVNIDEFKSRYQVLCSKYDPGYTAKHVFNQDHASFHWAN